MSDSADVLTQDAYLAIAQNLKLPTESFVGGEYRPAKSGKTMPTINPATGQVLTEVTACGAEDVDDAVTKAREAFDDGRWRSKPPRERKEILLRLCELITEHRDELAVMESLDSGKPIYDCAKIDIPDTINTIKWHAELIDKIYDQTAPVGDGALSVIVREPIGVVGAVLPWNFPLLMIAWKIGPALAAGNSVIVKPAEQTSLTGLRLAQLALEAGIPAGVFNVLPGYGPEVGEPIGRHMDIDMVSFTGSTETGRCFLRYAADSNLKKIVLECGGKNPFVVFDDAEDFNAIAEHVIMGGFWNMGENCSASSRLIVHEAVKKPLLDAVMARAQEWHTGDPLNPANRLGALVDKDHFGKVSYYLDQGKQAGARALMGGHTIDGKYVQPTIFDDAPLNAVINRDEIFGPVISVITARSNEEAIQIANNTSYGLAASIFSSNVKRAIRAARAIRAGTVTVNCYGEGDITTPFGGYKQSGFGGRDNSIHAHDQYTELKTIWIDLS
ncbi:MAG: aldehyde dehydrogenase [Anaerolineae bacterium]|nr:aldehyde dehydrogenase [Anaerolineae bacterium]